MFNQRKPVVKYTKPKVDYMNFQSSWTGRNTGFVKYFQIKETKQNIKHFRLHQMNQSKPDQANRYKNN